MAESSSYRFEGVCKDFLLVLNREKLQLDRVFSTALVGSRYCDLQQLARRHVFRNTQLLRRSGSYLFTTNGVKCKHV